MVGLAHTTAPVELRERVAFPAAEHGAALSQLTDWAGSLLEQAAILSTCNRVELYGVTRQAPVPEALVEFLARYHGLAVKRLAPCVYVHQDDEVMHHLAATACGMNSLVLGEAQIAGQVRAALGHAVDAGTAGPELRRLFDAAIAASRRVRSRTSLGRGVASVPQASVDFARRRLGTLDQATVLLIGAGNTGELAAKQLVRRGVGQLLVTGRDQVRSARLAERYLGHAVSLDRLSEALTQSDVVLCSTGAPRPILRRQQIEPAVMHRDPTDPLLLIDFSVPRDVDPSVAALAGVELHTIDDLDQFIEHTLADRRAELPAAHAILATEVARFTGWLRRREAAA
jgi:glutamyl-tRNA reductase